MKSMKYHCATVANRHVEDILANDKEMKNIRLLFLRTSTVSHVCLLFIKIALLH